MNEFKTDVQGIRDIYTIEYKTNSRANYEEVQNLLRKFVDNKPRTNFDRITESVESLAEYFISQANCDDCDKNKHKCKKACKNEFIQWLNSEVEE